MVKFCAWRKLLISISLGLLSLGVPAHADVLALNILGPDWNTFDYYSNSTVGFAFSISQQETVSGLGFWSPTSFSCPSCSPVTQVGLWSNSGTLLGSVSTATLTPQIVSTENGYGRWNFMTFSLVLSPGTYVVGSNGAYAYYAYDWDTAPPDPPSSPGENAPVSNYLDLAPGTAFIEGLFNTANDGLNMPNADCDFTIGGNGNCPVGQFGGNIEFANATPLPAALPLFATGVGALGLLGWRRKRKAAAVAV
jgi:hypothetical protein